MHTYRVVARQVKFQDHLIIAKSEEDARNYVENNIGVDVAHEEITEWEVVNVEVVPERVGVPGG